MFFENMNRMDVQKNIRCRLTLCLVVVVLAIMMLLIDETNAATGYRPSTNHNGKGKDQ